MENNTPTIQPNINNQNPDWKAKIMEVVYKFQPLFKEMFEKVYKNKKLFWLFAGIFGFMIVLIIIGSIYKLTNQGGGQSNIINKTTPSPSSTFINTGGKIYDDLTIFEDKLIIIKDSMINYDARQKRLTPPNIDFDISF